MVITTPSPKKLSISIAPSDNKFRLIEEIEPDMSSGPPFISFETLVAAPEAMLVLYHSDVVRLGAGNYAYEQDHI